MLVITCQKRFVLFECVRSLLHVENIVVWEKAVTNDTCIISSVWYMYFYLVQCGTLKLYHRYVLLPMYIYTCLNVPFTFCLLFTLTVQYSGKVNRYALFLEKSKLFWFTFQKSFKVLLRNIWYIYVALFYSRVVF